MAEVSFGEWRKRRHKAEGLTQGQLAGGAQGKTQDSEQKLDQPTLMLQLHKHEYRIREE